MPPSPVPPYEASSGDPDERHPGRSLAVRSLRELAVIVVGVLTALAIEGWWAEREERALEHEYLVALAAEAEGNRDAVRSAASVVELNAHALARGRRLLAVPLQADSAAALLESLLQGSMISPVTSFSFAVFEDLRSTGRLRLIEDEAVRLAVVRHYAALDAAIERQEDLGTAIDSRLHGLVSRHVPAGGLGQRGPRVILRPDSVSAQELVRAARALHGHPDVRGEVNATARRREFERTILELLGEGIDTHREILGPAAEQSG